MDVCAINLLLQQIWRQQRLTVTYHGPHLDLQERQSKLKLEINVATSQNNVQVQHQFFSFPVSLRQTIHTLNI